MVSKMGMWLRSREVGSELTRREVIRSVTMKHAVEFRENGDAFGLLFDVFSKGQAERRRGPSELASAFLFPNCC